MTMETRQCNSERNNKKYIPYGEDFVVDKTVLDDVTDLIVGLDEIVVSQNMDLIDDTETDWIDDQPEPEVEFKPEMEQMHEQELTNLWVLKWLHAWSTCRCKRDPPGNSGCRSDQHQIHQSRQH